MVCIVGIAIICVLLAMIVLVDFIDVLYIELLFRFVCDFIVVV